MATFWIFPLFRVFQDNGQLAPGAVANFYEPGTNTAKTVYADAELTTSLGSSITADAFGVFRSVYIDGPAGVKVDATYGGVSLAGYPRDNVSGIPVGGLSAASIPFAATARVNADDVQEAITDVDSVVEKVQAALIPVVSGGSSSAYTLTASLASYSAYTTGDVHLFQANHTSVGASTIDLNNIGSASIKVKNTSGVSREVTGNEIQQGDMCLIYYDGTDFLLIGQRLSPATQAAAQAGTERGTYMDPLRVAEAIDAQALGQTEGTTQATTSGTEHDFTSIPATATTIRLTLNRVSTNGSNSLALLIGDSGGFESSGYESNAYSGTNAYSTAAFQLTNGVVAGDTYSGLVDLVRLDGSSNTWVMKGDIGSTANGFNSSAGSKTLSGTLDRLRLTTLAGSNTFDAGSVNVSYITKP